MATETTKRKINYFIFFPILLMVFTVGQIASDMYVPSMPIITKLFHTTSSVLQWSMATYMLGFSIFQLFYGPLSDSFGRRVILLVGLTVGIIGSFVCFFARSPEALIVGRLVQGIGMGVGAALGRAIMRDLFAGSMLAKVGSLLGIGTTFMIGSAPVIGSYFQHYIGWRSIFGFITIYTLIIWFLVCFLLPETKLSFERRKISILKVLEDYWILLSSRIFMGNVLCSMLAYAGCLAFFTISPFLLQNIVGLTVVQFAWATIVIPLSMFCGSFINVYFIPRIGINRMILIGAILMIIAGGAMLIAVLLGFINTLVIIIPAMIFAIGAIFLMCNAFAGAFTPFPEIAGAAGAVYGCLQILGGFISTSLIALMKCKTQEPLAIIYLVLGTICILSFTQLVLRHR